MRSKNVPTVQLAGDVGLQRVADVARQAGIESPMETSPALALGTVAVSPLELATAYTAFATLGDAVQPRLVLKVDARRTARCSGRRGPPERRAVLDPAVAFLVTDVLRDAVARGTGTPARQALPAGDPGGGEDGHHQRRHRRLVRRLHAGGRGGGVGRLRPAARRSPPPPPGTRGGAGLGPDDGAPRRGAAPRPRPWKAPPAWCRRPSTPTPASWSPRAARRPTRTTSCSCAATSPPRPVPARRRARRATTRSGRTRTGGAGAQPARHGWTTLREEIERRLRERRRRIEEEEDAAQGEEKRRAQGAEEEANDERRQRDGESR